MVKIGVLTKASASATVLVQSYVLEGLQKSQCKREDENALPCLRQLDCPEVSERQSKTRYVCEEIGHSYAFVQSDLVTAMAFSRTSP